MSRSKPRPQDLLPPPPPPPHLLDPAKHPLLLCEAAAKLRLAGLNVLPGTQYKVPAVAWTSYQKRAMTADKLMAMIGNQADRVLSVGFLCGRMPGVRNWTLAVRDWDNRAAFEAWEAAYPKLAAQTFLVDTRRGVHSYWRLPAGSRYAQFHKFKDGSGEWRARQTDWVVAPYSVCCTPIYALTDTETPIGWHWFRYVPRGPLPTRYTDIPIVRDPREYGLVPATWQPRTRVAASHTPHPPPKLYHLTTTPGGSAREWTESDESGSENAVGRDELVEVYGEEDGAEVWRAVRKSVPTGTGERNACLMRFVWYLCRIDHTRPVDEWEPALLAWWTLARPIVATKLFAVSRAEFVALYAAFDPDKVGGKRAARNPDKVVEARCRAVRYDTGPPSDPALPPGQDRVMKVCRILAEANAGGQFGLSSHWLGDVLGVTQQAAHGHLRTLVKKGILDCQPGSSRHQTVRSGGPSGRREKAKDVPSRYWIVDPLPPSDAGEAGERGVSLTA